MQLPDVASHLWDLTQNAVDAGADKITIALYLAEDGTRLRLRDNGCGMTRCTRRKAMRYGFSTKPFSRGAGLPLARDHAQTFALRSRKGRGTFVAAYFRSVPAGDLKGTLALMERVYPSVHFCVRLLERHAHGKR